MPSYIAPEYEEIERMLDPFVEEHKLDKVTVDGLIKGSVEVLEPEIPTASAVVINMGDQPSAVSIHPKNIKINFTFALNSIFSFKTILDTKGAWLALSVLKIIVYFIKDMSIQLSTQETMVLFALYRLQSATAAEITAYIEKLKATEGCADIQVVNVENTLNLLEKIGTIAMRDGKYYVCETILITKS